MSTDGIFTPEELQAIDRCNISAGNDGNFSEEAMSRAIAALRESGMIEEVEHTHATPAHARYCVKKAAKETFFDRDVYAVHAGGGSGDTSPSEEAILLDIEVLRRSGIPVKKQFFKKKEQGGVVVFGPWWNFAFRRVMALPSDSSADTCTAVMIVRSLLALLKDDLTDVMKKATLKQLTKNFNIDLERCVAIARRAVPPGHFLDGELSAVEAYVEGLRAKSKPAAPAAVGASPAQSNVAAAANASDAAAAEKRKAEASKKRMDEMRARMLTANVAAAAAPPAPAPAPGSSPSKAADPRTGSARKPPPEKLVNDQRGTAPAQPNHTSQSSGGTSQSRGGPSTIGGTASTGTTFQIGRSNDGWGRDREGDSVPEPFKTKGSWAFRRNILGHNIPVDSPPPREPVQRSNVARGEDAGSARGGSSDHRGPPDRRREFDDRGGDRRDPGYGRPDPRPDDRYSDRSGPPRDYARSDSRGREYGGRSSHRDRDDGERLDRDGHRGGYHRGDSRGGGYPQDDLGRGGGSRDYERSDSRGGDYRDDRRGDPHRQARGPDGGSRDYGGRPEGSSQGYGRSYAQSQGSKHGQSQELDDRPSKRFRGVNEPSAPAGAGRGRGRGVDVNKPAWMTSGGSGPGMAAATYSTYPPASANASAPALPSNNDLSAILSAATSTPAPAANYPAPPQGRGRGRGTHATRPAWMDDEGLAAQVQHAPPQQVARPPAQQHSAVASMGAGRGRGRGTHATRPAWMDDEGLVAQALQAPPPQQQPPSRQIQQRPVQPSGAAPMGRGRGRGRGVNLPAWMTNGPGGND